MEYGVYKVVEELLQNPELDLDLNAGRINLRKIEKELRKTYSTSLDEIENIPIIYLITNNLLERQMSFTEEPEVIIDFGYGFTFERLSYIPVSVWFTLMILKLQNRLDSIKICSNSEALLDDLKNIYPKQAIEEIVETPLSKCPIVTTVFSNYHKRRICTARAVRFYNVESSKLDWTYEEYTVEPVYYPAGFRLLENQARWIRYKGYVPKI